jgi:hypothetical protein
MGGDVDKTAAAERLIQQAEVLLLQVALASGEDRDAVYVDAYDILVRAEVTVPGSASWRIACICARQGRGEHCRKWLERSHRTGALPGRATVEKHPDLDRIRAQKWFKRFLAQLD